MKLPVSGTHALVVVLSGWGLLACGAPPECSRLEKISATLDQDLAIPRRGDLIGAEAITHQSATKLKQRVSRLEGEFPSASDDEGLNVLLFKMAKRRAALNGALDDFLSSDPSKLPKGWEDSSLMPTRRGIEMSRNSLVDLVAQSQSYCKR